MRRRALLCGLAALSGCAGVFDDDSDRSRETVAPSLRGTPAAPPAVAWTASVGVDRLYPVDDAVVAVREDGTRERHVALAAADGTRRWQTEFDSPRSVLPGDTLVTWPVLDDDAPVLGLDPTTGERRWSLDRTGSVTGLTADTVVVRQDDPTRTVAYDRADGSRRWQSPRGERHLRWTNDPVVTLERVDSATTPSDAVDAVRLRGRTTDGGAVAWSIRVPSRTRSMERLADTGDRLLFADDRQYYLLDAAAGEVAADGAVPSGVTTGYGVAAADGVVLGDRLPEGGSEPPATLARIGLGDGETTVAQTAGEAVRPMEALHGRVVAGVQTGDGPRTAGFDPTTLSSEWDAPGVPLGSVSGSVVVGTAETVRAHAPDGSVRWRADRPAEGRFGSLGAFDDRTAYGFVHGERVVVVSDDGVASWDATDGEQQTATTAVGASEAWTVTGDTVVVAGDRLSAVRL